MLLFVPYHLSFRPESIETLLMHGAQKEAVNLKRLYASEMGYIADRYSAIAAKPKSE